MVSLSKFCMNGSGNGEAGGEGVGATPLLPVLSVVMVYISSGFTVSLTLPSAPTGRSPRFWKTWASGGLSPRLFEDERLEYLRSRTKQCHPLSRLH